MLRQTALVAISILGFCGPVHAGVLSATDIQRIRYYEQFVVPADREIPMLRHMEAQARTLISVAEQSGQALNDESCSEFGLVVRDWPRSGGQTLEKMVSALQSIHDPSAFAAPEWVAMLTEVTAELEERLAYDLELLKAFQTSVASGKPVLQRSFATSEDRPKAADRWDRFKRIFDRPR